MPTSHQKLPVIMSRSPEEIDGLIKRLNQSGLSQYEQDFFTGCVELATWLPEALKENKITIRQLQNLIFGAMKSGKNKKKKKGKTGDSCAEKENSTSPDNQGNEQLETSEPATKALAEVSLGNQIKRRGHGRYGHELYVDAHEMAIHHTDLKAGDSCPLICGGKLYSFKPGILIRVTGNSLATVNKYHVERLRCASCSHVFKAPLPNAVGIEKYDAKFKAIIAVQKYYVGLPFYRQASFQSHLNFPLAASVQYELSEQVANCAYPVLSTLEKGIANGKLVNNDDTYVKILSVIKDNKAHPDKERTGMYTSCIMGKMENHSVALYYTGVKHAGENLGRLLQYRDASKPPIIQMCDALSANLPKTIKTILCNCLGHGFRKFDDLIEFYPEACLYVIKALGQVFKHEEEAKKMTEQERFRYHRLHSKPIMLQLHRWLKKQFETHAVEPNSALGKAISYLLRHWKKLRRFLVVPGCQIDNHVVERALKIPIRVRKTAMFYKTEHGAVIGSLLTSLIHTAVLCKENPIDYLVALQQNKSAVFKDPAAWVPWRYRATLKNQWLSAA